MTQKGNGLIGSTDEVIKFEDYPCTRGEVANYLTNWANKFHAPDHKLLMQLAAMLDTMFIYFELEGAEIKDGRLKFTVDDLVKWANEHMEDIKKWKQQKALELLPSEQLGREA